MNGINILKNHYQKLTLINKKTGKVSSSHHWFLALAANAYQQNHTRGISSLLPLSRAKKILKHNILDIKKKRPGQDKTSQYMTRQGTARQAKTRHDRAIRYMTRQY